LKNAVTALTETNGAGHEDISDRNPIEFEKQFEKICTELTVIQEILTSELLNTLDQILVKKQSNPDVPINIEEVVESVLSSKKLHNSTKCALAEKLTDWLKQPLLLQNIRKATDDVVDNHYNKLFISLNDAKLQLIQDIKTIMIQYEGNHMKEMENLLQSSINIGDNITSKFNTLEDYVKDNGKCIASQINTLDMKTDHNTKHFEKVLHKSVTDFNQALQDKSFNINSGQNEILSIMKDHDKTLSEISNSQEKIINIERQVKNMGEVLDSFDSHITELKTAMSLIPHLHKTMKDIVDVMNTTLGEELIETPKDDHNDTKNINEDTDIGEAVLEDTDVDDQDNIPNVEPKEKTTKQRISKRQTNRKKK
jgi:hypothetical protein